MIFSGRTHLAFFPRYFEEVNSPEPMLIWPHSEVVLVCYGSPDLRSLAHNFLILLYYCIHLAHLNLALICLNLLLKVNCSEKNLRLKNVTSCIPDKKCHSCTPDKDI